MECLYICELIHGIESKLKPVITPIIYREPDDPRIDTYYISINRNTYIVINGVCGYCDDIYIYTDNNITDNIMTLLGIRNYVDKIYNDNKINNSRNVICQLDLKLTKFNTYNDLITVIINALSSHIHL